MRPASLLTVLALPACQDERRSTPPASTPEPAVVVRDVSGADRLVVDLAGATCTTSGEAAVTVARSAAPPPSPRTIGSTVLRVHRAPGRVDLIDTQGIPLARITIEDRAARVVDAARAPVAALAREGGRVTVSDPGGAVVAYVSGTSDLEVAALLVAPGVPADARATLACERLLAEPSTHEGP